MSNGDGSPSFSYNYTLQHDVQTGIHIDAQVMQEQGRMEFESLTEPITRFTGFFETKEIETHRTMVLWFNTLFIDIFWQNGSPIHPKP